MAGFSGPNCEENIDECAAVDCGHGQCQDGLGTYLCVCDKGWTGNHCNSEIDECASDPCRNGGTCKNIPNGYGYECRCPLGTTGGIEAEGQIEGGIEAEGQIEVEGGM